MSRPTSDQTPVVPSQEGYGRFFICPSCSRQSDIWAELCECGVALLPDDRKMKLAKSGGAAAARMVRRCARLEALDTVAAREQAVRDLAALRETSEAGRPGDYSYTTRIVLNLIKLDRLDQACDEAGSLPLSGSSAAGSLVAIEAVAHALHGRHDAREELWLRRALGMRSGGREHLELQIALVDVLADAGRHSEALEGFEAAAAELDALRKKSSKSTVAMLSGSGEAFATSYWSAHSNKLDALRKPVVGAGAASAVSAGRAALAEAQGLERSGDIAGARDAADESARILSATMKRMKPLIVGLSRSDAKETMEPLEVVVRALEVEHKRLKKLAKRS